MDDLNSVKLYENDEKYQKFRVVYNVDPQVPIKNMEASKVSVQDIQSISVKLNQMIKDVELDTLYIAQNPGKAGTAGANSGVTSGAENKQTMDVQIGLINPDTNEVVTYTGTFEYDNQSKDNVINLYEIVNNSNTLDSITK